MTTPRPASSAARCGIISSLAALALAALAGCSPPAEQPPATSSGAGASPSSAAAPVGERKKKFTLAVSIYAGWMPWYFANETGIIARHAERECIEIETLYMDYIPSVEAFVAQKADACVMTNMEALNMPAASGVDTTAFIIGDYSNGNDAILTRGDLDVDGLQGREVLLVELSVSHYLLARALEINGMKEDAVRISNISDSDIGPAFTENDAQQAVVTWNPIVLQIEQTRGVRRVFDSSGIPGEILDLCVANTATLQANPELGRALTGAWYEVMARMSQRGKTADAAMAKMADAAGCSLQEYKAQLRTTAMFWTPGAAADYASGAEIRDKMEFVRQFCFRHGLLGEDSASVDAVGIAYPEGAVQGDPGNVKLRFDASYMQAAAEKADAPAAE